MSDRYERAFIGPDGDPSLVDADREMVAYADVLRVVKGVARIPQSLDYAEFTRAQWDELRRAISVAGAMLDDAYQTCMRNLPFTTTHLINVVGEYDPGEPSQAEEAADRLRELGQ